MMRSSSGFRPRLQFGRWRERRVQDRVGQPPGVRFVERPPAGRHLVEHDPERVDVGARVNRLATHLLGRHVRQRPLEPADRPRRRLFDVGGGARQLRQAEVQHLHPALGRDDDVGRLEIAVHDAALVRLLERRRHVAAECRDLFLRERAAGDVLRQRLAGHVLHDQEVDPVAAVEIVHRGDVRVVQPGQRLRFTPEPPPCRLVGQHARWQHLEGDVAIEMLVAGAVDLAHPAFAELLDDPVVREGAADHFFGGRGSDARWNRASMPGGVALGPDVVELAARVRGAASPAVARPSSRRTSQQVALAERVALSVGRGDVAAVVALRHHRARALERDLHVRAEVLAVAQLPKMRF